jgi:putative endonuclease
MHGEYYYAYIVASRSRTLSIGFTSDISKRTFQHKEKTYEGFSATYNCNRLVWFERFGDVVQAIQREKQLKGWTRIKKISLIESANPTWVDLSDTWHPHFSATSRLAKSATSH